MRRTALYLGGLLLASGASLALAGPASAAPSDRCCRDNDEARVVAVLSDDEDECWDDDRSDTLVVLADDDDDDYRRPYFHHRKRHFGGGFGGNFGNSSISQVSGHNYGIGNGNQVALSVLGLGK